MLPLFLILSCSSVQAVSLKVQANPIRTIVTLLQDMQKEIEVEGEKEQESFDKFMCYCDGSTDDMKKGADEGAQRVEELASKLEALKAEKTQLEQELAQHKSDRAQAKQDQEKAQSLREKENGEFSAAELDMQKNIAAMKNAISALEKGTGSFLQLPRSRSSLCSASSPRRAMLTTSRSRTPLRCSRARRRRGAPRTRSSACSRRCRRRWRVT